MKHLDKVKIISNNKLYIKQGLKFEQIGRKDLELIEKSNISNAEILDALPNHDARWWCKVEDGYILNLLGEKKNKIPYDYNS